MSRDRGQAGCGSRSSWVGPILKLRVRRHQVDPSTDSAPGFERRLDAGYQERPQLGNGFVGPSRHVEPTQLAYFARTWGREGAFGQGGPSLGTAGIAGKMPLPRGPAPAGPSRPNPDVRVRSAAAVVLLFSWARGPAACLGPALSERTGIRPVRRPHGTGSPTARACSSGPAALWRRRQRCPRKRALVGCLRLGFEHGRR